MIRPRRSFLFHFTGLAILVAASVAAQGADDGDPQSITFRFDLPGDRIGFTQFVEVHKTQQTEGSGRRVDEARLEARVTIERVEDGYRMTTEPVAAGMSRDGQEISNPVLTSLANVRFVTVLDEEGSLVRIEGIPAFLREVLAEAEPAVAEALRKVLSVEALVAKEQAEWDGRIGQFIGLTVDIGAVLEAPSSFTLPNGETLDFVNVYSFPRTVECGSATCVEVRHTYTSEADAAAQLGAETAGKLIASLGAKDPELTGSGGSISGNITRVIDPATMRIYGEVMERTLVFSMTTRDGEAVETNSSEKRVYSFEYDE